MKPRRLEPFTFPGIGKLVLVKCKARVGRNPATGEQIKIPAKTVVKMRAVAKKLLEESPEYQHLLKDLR